MTDRPPRITDTNRQARNRQKGKPRKRTEVVPPVYLEPWEKQPRESSQRYEAFLVYRDQLDHGQLRRSLERAAHAVKKHPQTLAEWSREDHWRERAAAWDRHLQSVRDAQHIRAVEAIAARQGMQVQAAAATLQAPIQALLEKIQRDHDYLDQLSAWQLTRLALAASRAMPVVIQSERLIQGLSTQNVDAHVEGDVTLRDARAAAEAMTTVARERFLIGEGIEDGRAHERQDAARRAQERGG